MIQPDRRDQVGTYQGRGTHTGIRGPSVLPASSGHEPETDHDDEESTVPLAPYAARPDLTSPPDPETSVTPLYTLNELDEAIERLDDSVPCRSYDPEVFFAETPEDVEYAKSLCGTCPLREACLAGAKDRREPWGVWGGELFVQGVVVPRKRPRGRPRKNPVTA
ncbi:hypothetical protein GCM10022245_62830 [Streptomyces mayteni]